MLDIAEQQHAVDEQWHQELQQLEQQRQSKLDCLEQKQEEQRRLDRIEGDRKMKELMSMFKDLILTLRQLTPEQGFSSLEGSGDKNKFTSIHYTCTNKTPAKDALTNCGVPTFVKAVNVQPFTDVDSTFVPTVPTTVTSNLLSKAVNDFFKTENIAEQNISNR